MKISHFNCCHGKNMLSCTKLLRNRCLVVIACITRFEHFLISSLFAHRISKDVKIFNECNLFWNGQPRSRRQLIGGIRPIWIILRAKTRACNSSSAATKMNYPFSDVTKTNASSAKSFQTWQNCFDFPEKTEKKLISCTSVKKSV